MFSNVNVIAQSTNLEFTVSIYVGLAGLAGLTDLDWDVSMGVSCANWVCYVVIDNRKNI